VTASCAACLVEAQTHRVPYCMSCMLLLRGRHASWRRQPVMSDGRTACVAANANHAPVQVSPVEFSSLRSPPAQQQPCGSAVSLARRRCAGACILRKVTTWVKSAVSAVVQTTQTAGSLTSTTRSISCHSTKVGACRSSWLTASRL